MIFWENNLIQCDNICAMERGDVGYEPLLISNGIRKNSADICHKPKLNDSTITDMTFFRWQRLAPLQPNHCPYSTEDNVCFELIKSSTNCSYICAYAQPLVLYPALWVEYKCIPIYHHKSQTAFPLNVFYMCYKK